MKFCDVRQSRFSKRNLFARFCITLVYNVIITFLAALIPFFGEWPAPVGTNWTHVFLHSCSCTPAILTVLTYLCIHPAKSLQHQLQPHAAVLNEPPYLHHSQQHQSGMSVSAVHTDFAAVTLAICMKCLVPVLVLALLGKSGYHVVTMWCGQTALHHT